MSLVRFKISIGIYGKNLQKIIFQELRYLYYSLYYNIECYITKKTKNSSDWYYIRVFILFHATSLYWYKHIQTLNINVLQTITLLISQVKSTYTLFTAYKFLILEFDCWNIPQHWIWRLFNTRLSLIYLPDLQSILFMCRLVFNGETQNFTLSINVVFIILFLINFL